MKRITLTLLILALCLTTYSQFLEYNNNRIAISADGNNADDFKDKWPRADEDDWGATPASMAIIAKLRLYDKLVHFSYNNFIEGNRGADSENMMDIGVQGGIKRLRFDPEIFFDVTKELDKAQKSLIKELSKSTAQDPLFFIHMGPSEFFYQCVKECVDNNKQESLSHVYVISHSGYNDNHIRRPYHHTMQQAIDYSGGRIKYKRIKDQNAKWSADQLWNSGKDFSVWYWMRDSKDPNIQWLYERMSHNPKGTADISDAGMLYYLVVGDEDGSPSKFKNFLGKEIVPNSIVHPTKVTTETKKLLVFKNQTNIIKATIHPELTSDKRLIWESKNTEIATVKDGVVFGKKEGNTTIIATTIDGKKSTSVNITVEKLNIPDERIIYTAIDKFNNLNIPGFAPAYKDNTNKAIAINAELYKDKFTAASTVFTGKTGLYDITLKTLRELDGESWYRIRVGGRLVGEFRNKNTEKDYSPSYLTARKVTIQNGETIQIESNSASNFKVPEGNTFAYSRGRWAQIVLNAADLNINARQDKAIITCEAEKAKLRGHWEIGTDKLASNNKYITYTGANQYKTPSQENEIEISLYIKTPGTYTVKWIMRQPQGHRGSDLGNDVWLNFSDAIQLGGNQELTGFNKFVSRSDDTFVYGGQLDLHGKQPWLHVRFDKAGTYTIKLTGRSQGLQIDKFILFKGISGEELEKELNIKTKKH